MMVAWTEMKAVEVNRFKRCIGCFQDEWHGWSGGRRYHWPKQ